MSSTNKTTYYELSQYVGTDKPTYLTDYNGDMRKIDTGIHDAAADASTALSTANSAASTAATASTNASAAVTTANSADSTALTAKSTAETASTNASAALTAAAAAESAAAANTIGNLAPAYDPTLTYAVDDLVTFIDAQGSGKLYKCIIAVDAPEAFNINKWDDVTTSEVYADKPKIIASAEGSATKTYADILFELAGCIDYAASNPTHIFELVSVSTAGEVRRYLNSVATNISIRFSSVGFYKSGSSYYDQLEHYHIQNTSASDCYAFARYLISAAGTGAALTNNLSDISEGTTESYPHFYVIMH